MERPAAVAGDEPPNAATPALNMLASHLAREPVAPLRMVVRWRDAAGGEAPAPRECTRAGDMVGVLAYQSAGGLFAGAKAAAAAVAAAAAAGGRDHHY